MRAGDEISVHYDPMLAKLIVHAVDRPAALEMLQAALARFHVCPIGFIYPSSIRLFFKYVIWRSVCQNDFLFVICIATTENSIANDQRVVNFNN